MDPERFPLGSSGVLSASTAGRSTPRIWHFGSPGLLLVIAALVTGVAAPVAAQDPTSLDELLADLAEARAEIESWSGDLEMRMSLEGTEMSSRSSMVASGQLMRSVSEMDAMGQVVSTLSVVDPDGVLWTEMEMMGQVIVQRMDRELLEEMVEQAEASGAAPLGGTSPLGPDPASMLSGLQQMYELELGEDETMEDGTEVYVLYGTATDAMVQMLGPAGEPMARGIFRIGKEDGFLRTVAYLDSNDLPVVEMVFGNLQFDVDVDPDTFAYTPPAGAQVMDLAELMQQAGPFRLDDTGRFSELHTLESLDSYVAFSPSGQLLATAVGAALSPLGPAELRLWDAETGAEVALLGSHSGGIAALAFSPDGQMIATGGRDHVAKLWDVEGREEIRTLEGHPSWVIRAAFSPDGRTLATAGGGDPAYIGENEIRLWSVETGEEQSILRFAEFRENDIYSLAFSPNGRMLATGSAYTAVPPATGTDGRLTLWDLETGEERTLFQDPRGAVLSVAFSPDGQTVAAGFWTRTIRLWEVATGTPLGQLEGHSNWVMSLAFSPDGRRLVSSSGNPRDPSLTGEVMIWDVETFEPLARQTTGGLGVRYLSLSPDGRRLAAGLIGGLVRVWEVDLSEPRPAPVSIQ